MQRDYNDLQKLITWPNHQGHNPFDSNRTNLQTLVSGLIDDELITCDDTENIGGTIQQSLDNVAQSDASIQQSQQAITLASLKPSAKMGNQTVVIDPMVIFPFGCMMQRTNDIPSYFA